jgi:hypothetical protein
MRCYAPMFLIQLNLQHVFRYTMRETSRNIAMNTSQSFTKGLQLGSVYIPSRLIGLFFEIAINRCVCTQFFSEAACAVSLCGTTTTPSDSNREAMAGTGTIDAKLNLADREFQVITSAYRDTTAQLVFLRDEIYRVADIHEIAPIRTVHCSQVGHHKKNRPLTVPNCPKKLATLNASGYSSFELMRATVVGREPGGVGDDYEQFCQQTSIDASGTLASVVKGSLSEFTLTCNHTFQGLRCGYFETLSTDPTISKNGRISKAIIAAKSPGLISAMDNGVKVRYFPWQFEKRYPELVECIIEADNIPFQAAEKDTTIDRLVKCHKLASVHVTSNGEPDWTKIEQIMMRTEIDRAHEIPELIAWLKSSAGGIKDPWVLNDVARFARTLKVMRDIPAGVLGKMGEVKLGPSDCPYWRGAISKSILVARASDMVNNVNTYVVANDVRSFGLNSLKFIEVANSYMLRARELAQDKVLKKLPKDELDVVIDTADIRFVGHILKRPLRGEFTSLLQIGYKMHGELVELASKHSLKYKVECPEDWAAADKHNPTGDKHCRVAPLALTVKELSKGSVTQEQAIAYLKGHGFEIAKDVREKGSQRTLVIKAIEPTCVVLHDVAKGDKARDEQFAIHQMATHFESLAKPQQSQDRNFNH